MISISHGMMVSLAVSCLASLALFIYFRNKISKIEHKVNLMFQLIQEHTAARNLMMGRIPAAAPQTKSGGVSRVPTPHLIPVSDDEESQDTDSGSEGSREVSDNENDPIEIHQSRDTPLAKIRPISLVLTGAEAGGEIEQGGTIGGGYEADLDIQEIEPTSAISVEAGKSGDSEMAVATPVVVSEQQQDGGVKQIQPEGGEKVEVVPGNVDVTLPSSSGVSVPLGKDQLTAMRVGALKELCEARNLKNYKSLRKPELVDLLVQA